LAKRLPLYTCNLDGLVNIDGLTLVSVPHYNDPGAAG